MDRFISAEFPVITLIVNWLVQKFGDRKLEGVVYWLVQKR